MSIFARQQPMAPVTSRDGDDAVNPAPLANSTAASVASQTRAKRGQQALAEIDSQGPNRGPRVGVSDAVMQWFSDYRHAPPEYERDDAGSNPRLTRFSGPLFRREAGDAHAVDIDDVAQGEIGNCYYIAFIAAIAHRRPENIEELITDNGDGTYTVRFLDLETSDAGGPVVTPDFVTVDSRFWTDASGQPIYARGARPNSAEPELWGMVLEKAWAKRSGGSYGDIAADTASDGSKPASAILGRVPTRITPSSVSADVLLETLATEMYEAGAIITFGTGAEDAEDLRLVGDHGYILEDLDVSTGRILLRNPWGSFHAAPLTIEDVRSHFSFIDIAKPHDE